MLGHRVWMAATIAAVALTACSSSKGGSTAGTTSAPTTATSTTAATSSTSPSTTATSNSSTGTGTGLIGLVAADLPAGWTPASNQQYTDNFGQTATCMRLDPSRSVVSSAASPYISSGAYQASSLTTSLSPAAVAMQEVDAAVTPAGLQCIKQVVERLAPGATVTVTTVNAPPLGDKSTGIHFSASSSTGSFVGENFFIAKGNQEITVQFTGTNSPFPIPVERSSLRKLAARLG